MEIAEAYRINRNSLENWLIDLDEYVLEDLSKAVITYMDGIKFDAFADWVEMNEFEVISIDHFKYLAFIFTLFNVLPQVSGDLNSWVELWIRGKWAYIIPKGFTLKNWNQDRYVMKDFSHHSELEISEQELNYRENKWNQIDQNFHGARLVHTIFRVADPRFVKDMGEIFEYTEEILVFIAKHYQFEEFMESRSEPINT